VGVDQVAGYVLLPGEGRGFGQGFSVKVERDTGASFAVFERALQPQSDGPPLHIHQDYDEAFYIIDGSVRFSLDGDAESCPPGSFVFIPRQVAHGYDNPHDAPARVLVVLTPAAIDLVEEFVNLGSHGPPDPKAVAEVFARHSTFPG
jgi:quercetin dioxygenase-like cupin family protein